MKKAVEETVNCALAKICPLSWKVSGRVDELLVSSSVDPGFWDA